MISLLTGQIAANYYLPDQGDPDELKLWMRDCPDY
jgi:hypothetical protein